MIELINKLCVMGELENENLNNLFFKCNVS